MVDIPQCVPGVRAVVADHLSEGRVREGDGGERSVGTVCEGLTRGGRSDINIVRSGRVITCCTRCPQCCTGLSTRLQAVHQSGQD